MAVQTYSARALQTGALEAKLSGLAPLGPPDLAAIRACCEDVRSHGAGAEILRVGEEGPPRLILEGWAGWTATLPDGRRQIVQILLPGDVVGLPPSPGGAVAALTTLKTADAAPLAAAVEGSAPEHRALRAAWNAVQQAGHRQLLDQVVRLGRRSAYERTAHLLLELLGRQHRAGLTDQNAMAWPLTQEMLADVLGLSIVHVNRTLQQLRRDGMIVLRTGRVTIPDVERLARVAEWDAAR